ncbi:hypothetical protein BsWGS_04621 [Bradybaena similaris]
MLLPKDKVFDNKTAWFSCSCPDNVKKLWVDNGGKLEDVELSQFVFSDDWEHDDTKILYNSEAYLKQHLAIFSSQYVPDAVREGIDNVSLGRYFLIPGPIRDSVNFTNLQSELVTQNNNTAGPSPKKAQQIPSSGNNHSNMQRKDDDSSSASRTGLLPAVTAPALQPLSGDTGKVATSQKKSKILADTEVVCALPEHRSICGEIRQIDLESIPHVQSLPKVISCLRTIYPGRDGVEVKHLT